MARILWTSWQQEHITESPHHRPTVYREDVEEAWHDPDRQDVEQGYDDDYGPCTFSFGAVRGKALALVWRFQGGSDDVWTVTAYFPKPKGRKRQKAKKKGKR